jgi:hypothetical protein
MPVIVKCSPTSLDAAGVIAVEVRGYKRCVPEVGEAAYVWFSETQGGEGLFGVGVIQDVQTQPERFFSLRIRMTQEFSVSQRLRVEDLRPHRDEPATAVGGLAGKLVRHSLNKVAVVDADEEQVLRARLNQTA